MKQNNSGLLLKEIETNKEIFEFNTLKEELNEKINKNKQYNDITIDEGFSSETNISTFNEISPPIILNIITKKPKEDIITKIIDEIGITNYQLKILLFSIFVTFSYGAEIVVMSLITRRLERIWHLNSMKKAALGGSLFYGFFIGAIFSGSLMNSKGRKFCFIIGSWLFLFFGISSAFSNEFYSFMFYRTGVGIGIGIVIPTVVTYITEMSISKYRGFIGNIIWIGYSLGELYICFIAKYFPLDNKILEQSNWTIILIFASIPILINLFLLNFIHESPRYALNNNQIEEGISLLQEMREDADMLHLSCDEIKRIEILYRKEKDIRIYSKTNKIGYSILFSDKYKNQTYNICLLAIVVSFLNFSLIYIIPELIGKTVENVNFHDLIRTIVFATVFESFGVLIAFMTEIGSIGRLGALRISFFISFFFAFISIFISDVHSFSICLFVLKGGVTLASRVLMIYLPECFNTEIRGLALGLTQSLMKVLGIVTPIICQILISFSTTSVITGLTSACLIGLLVSFSTTNETLNIKIE